MIHNAVFREKRKYLIRRWLVLVSVVLLFAASSPLMAKTRSRAISSALVTTSQQKDSTELAEQALDDIIRAVTSESLRRAEQRASGLEFRREVCNVELRDKIIPITCFSVLNEEKNLQLLDQATYQQQTDALNRLCTERALRAAQLPADVPDAVPLPCRKEVEMRRQDLLYAREFSAPSKSFAERFSTPSGSRPAGSRIE